MSRLIVTLTVWLAAAVPAAAVVDIDEVETPGGVTVWLVEESSIPFVALEIAFRGGTSVDPDGARGAVNLMTALLEEGAGDRDAAAFAAARDELAASFRFEASDDAVRVSARFLSETADAAVALLADALARPRFDPEAVERVRAQVVSSLRSRAEEPSAIASDAFAGQVYGDHPYASHGDGTPESVAALGVEDLREAHGAAIARDRVVVAAAGDIDAEAVGRIVDAVLADLPADGAPSPGPAQLSLAGDVTVVEADSPQAVIQFAQPGIARDDPDFFPAFVLNHILGGGGFGSRLMEEVRVKRGLTYGIYTYLADRSHADLLAGRVATANETAAETVEIVRAEWARLAEDGPTETELSQAKTYLIGGYPLRFDGNAAIARILAGMQLDGMPIDYVETRNQRVAAVTAEDVRALAAGWLDAERLTFVVAGRPEAIALGN